MALPILQSRDLPELAPDEAAVAGVTAAAVDLRWLALTLFIPLFDLRAIGDNWISALLLSAGYGLVGFAAGLLAARVSDRLGRRTLLIAGTAAIAIGAFCLIVRGSIWIPSVGRVLMGLGAGIGAAAGWVADAVHIDRRARVHGLIGISAAMAAWLGPSLGLALSRGPRWLAPAFIAGYATVSLVGLIRREETRKVCSLAEGPLPRSAALHAWPLILRSSALAGPIAAVLCGFAAAAISGGLLPGALLGMSAALVLLIAAASAITGALALAFASALANRGRAVLAIAMGAWWLWLAGVLLAGRAIEHTAALDSARLWRVIPAAMLIPAGLAAIASASVAALLERTPELWRGSALTLHQSGALLGAGLGAVVSVAAVSWFSIYLLPLPLMLFAVLACAAALLPRANAIATEQSHASAGIPSSQES